MRIETAPRSCTDTSGSFEHRTIMGTVHKVSPLHGSHAGRESFKATKDDRSKGSRTQPQRLAAKGGPWSAPQTPVGLAGAEPHNSAAADGRGALQRWRLDMSDGSRIVDASACRAPPCLVRSVPSRARAGLAVSDVPSEDNSWTWSVEAANLPPRRLPTIRLHPRQRSE